MKNKLPLVTATFITASIISADFASAAAITDLYNTGIVGSASSGPTGTLDAHSASDAHWNIVASPASFISEMVVRESAGFPIVTGGWLGETGAIYGALDSGASAWIGAADFNPFNGGSNTFLTSAPSGTYSYETLFTLPSSLSGLQVLVSGRWAYDDGGPTAVGSIQLNGTQVASTSLTASYGSWTPFNLNLNPNFQVNTNTFRFNVVNAAPSVTGVRVEWLDARVVQVPEPSSLVLLGLTLLGVFKRCRR
ncbi:MAG: PEP-CTERM sorting domain-containing protein [Gloeobacteraceae cyanobacterium ES-bin-144]|nr:PEP-CTERM sorting domain-containing protein [Verrucomicrobiales bacterium]